MHYLAYGLVRSFANAPAAKVITVTMETEATTAPKAASEMSTTTPSGSDQDSEKSIDGTIIQLDRIFNMPRKTRACARHAIRLKHLPFVVQAEDLGQLKQMPHLTGVPVAAETIVAIQR
eukprot:s136_g21.t1